MDNQMYQIGNEERHEGSLTTDLDMFDLGMDDREIADAIGNRVAQSEQFWNDKYNLDSVRKTADTYYLNKYYSQDDLYDWQVEYKDNRIFVAIETLVALAIARPPMPVVMQAYDTEASYELAQNLQKALLCKYEDLYLKGQFQMVARHLLMGYRLGVMKVIWDDQVGSIQEDGSRFGDVDVITLRPQRVVLDAGAQDISDVPLVAEYCSMPLEELLEKYPKKADEIKAEAGKKGKNHTSRDGYVEIHFTEFKKTGKRREAIVWKYGNVIMDSMVSPFWDYDETYTDEQGKTRQGNFLNKPTKPYVFFNFLNLGRFVIDDTSLMEQAIPNQKIVNKIGRQIVENAEQANSGTIFNSEFVKESDVAKLIGDPGEKILSKGNVNEAAARLPYNQLAEYVREERLDARNEIDNIFSTHGAIRGEVTGSKTLGQDVMSQRGDAARINVLATAIEDGADRLYKFITQTFKVFYDTPQLFKYSSEDSLNNFFSFGRDQIEDGASLKVKSGSVIPRDPIAEREETIQLLPILDPYNLAKGLGKENPKEWATQVLQHRLFPDQYMADVLGYSPESGGQDPLAMQHIQMLIGGKEVPPEQNVTKEYLATFQMFIESPEFQKLTPEIQQKILMFAEAINANAKNAMGMGDKPGMPEQSNNTMGVPIEADAGTGTPPISSPQAAPALLGGEGDNI